MKERFLHVRPVQFGNRRRGLGDRRNSRSNEIDRRQHNRTHPKDGVEFVLVELQGSAIAGGSWLRAAAYKMDAGQCVLLQGEIAGNVLGLIVDLLEKDLNSRSFFV